MAQVELCLPREPTASVESRTSGSLSDQQLVEHIVLGDAWATEVLYKRYVGSILGTVTRLLNSRIEAEDVVQDTFALALAEVPRLRERDRVRSWLIGIAVHQVHRRFRRRKLLRVLGFGSAEESELESLVTADADPEVRAQVAQIGKLLVRVAPAERIAWTLRYVEGYSLEEVAEACSCSLATAKRRILAAATLIRKYVEVREP